MNTFKTFLESVNGKHREIFYLPPQTLDEYLQKFSIGLRKEKTKEGESNEYQPCTFDSYQSMINIYLKKLTTTRLSAEFQGSRKCIKAKKQHSKELGHGNRPNVSDPVDFQMRRNLLNMAQWEWITNTRSFCIVG